jgi:hypothetical protein
MRFIYTILFFVSFGTFSSFSQLKIKGEGEPITKILTLENFNSLKIVGSDDVIVKQGDQQEVKVIGHSNIIDKIELKVKNGVWKIQLQKGDYAEYKLKFYITLPEIKSVDLIGSANVTLSAFNESKNISLKLISSGDILLNSFNGVDNLNVDIVGSGNVKANSEYSLIHKMDINITGSGNFNGGNLKAENCEVSITGSGNASVEVVQKLTAKIAGSGNVYYKGQAEIVKEISGSGVVEDRN